MTVEMDARPGRRLPAWAGHAIVGAIIIGLVAWSAWWATHPNRFASVGNRIGTAEAKVGVAYLYGVSADPRADVDVRSVRPRVTENSAQAGMRVLWCDHAELLGSALGPAEAYCESVEPVTDGTLRPFKRGVNPQLIVELRPTRPGRVLIDGFGIAYRSGFRWGWQNAGIVIDVTARPNR
jgi:hypothetical protein